MTLDASSYFDHIKAYISDEYIVHRGEEGEVILREKYFREGDTKKSLRVVRLPYKGKAFALKLDGRNKPLFDFLDDNGKEWSKRCDFIIFHYFNRRIVIYLFEFKTKSLDAGSIIDQLRSGVHWCACLRRVVAQYTGHSRPLKTKKFVLTENNNPDAYLDAERKYLARDPSVRHYHYDEVAALSLEDLENNSINTI
ncbi:hypothetical protein ABQZ99_014455 [Xanthomonas hortorum pv. vitians]|uniref:Uncharacterized protein n=1 Tax=Xanthomonas hortorum pv. vitians TaxID=83224 RepID=A0A6V7D5G4_9XANT|nr:hypothetical protein [Xanthomonas hortorum]APP83937.1 hypothetical protein BI317_06770 [Xanthomonas hortorum pv. gardneri]ASW46142.1 hypothetical protein XJ27_09390 [Xanthomonas hortorum]MCE4279712.1 hypothetical protein [Xanthomonas hortorum pv. vitians]MCE4286283.1 hypothetical protein [Xanthomonas hortorum pv. vitians]MCE4298304.1 hypothetical protein [Xanthomonas hortorum pv. vitians]